MTRDAYFAAMKKAAESGKTRDGIMTACEDINIDYIKSLELENAYLQDKVNELLANALEWHKAADDLPVDNDWGIWMFVVAIRPGGTRFISMNQWFGSEGWGDACSDAITHWAYAPDLPEA